MPSTVTGGTGSFGHAFVPMTLAKYNPRRLVIYSRDEMKQWEMAKLYAGDNRVRFFIGDVWDKDRLVRALDGVDYVVHAAATKIVPTAEYNPFECVKTNVIGAMNLIDACIDKKVKRIVALSTDKASSPINLYGATKLTSDKLFIAGNSYSGGGDTRFGVVRYGNVMGSRGSVIPFFLSLADKGRLPITDERMTRFMITLEQGVELVWHAFEDMVGGIRNVANLQRSFTGLFSDLYLDVMKDGVVNQLRHVVDNKDDGDLEQAVIKAASRLCAEASNQWPDDPEIGPLQEVIATELVSRCRKEGLKDLEDALTAFEECDEDHLNVPE